MSILIIRLHKKTGTFHVIRETGDNKTLEGIYYFLHDAERDYPTACYYEPTEICFLK